MDSRSAGRSGGVGVSYQIVVRGEVTERFAESLEGVVVESAAGQSVLRAENVDQVVKTEPAEARSLPKLVPAPVERCPAREGPAGEGPLVQLAASRAVALGLKLGGRW